LIMTFGSAMELLLSISALVLTIGVLLPVTKIYRRWNISTEAERPELEKTFYLAFAAVIIILGIRLFLVPLYFWTMQGFVPMIPGAMCLWGVFDSVPEVTWGSLLLKFVLPVAFIGWLLLSFINGKCKTHPLMQNMMAFFIAIVPLVLIDSALDIYVFGKIAPIQVSCCSDAIDVGTRPVPGVIAGISGQTLLVSVFLLLAALYSLFLFLSLKRNIGHALTLVLSIPLAAILVLTITETLTPWLLNLPFHHCPFCLFFEHPLSILFTGLLWFGLATPWLLLITNRLGKENGESKNVEAQMRKSILTYAGISMIISLALICMDLLIAFS
jgi:hypothetical protein